MEVRSAGSPSPPKASDTPEGQKGTEFLSAGKLDEFWAGPTNKSRPSLRELVAVFFTIRASTAAVERFFSTTGLILVPRRNQLSDDKFKKISILRQEMRSGGEFKAIVADSDKVGEFKLERITKGGVMFDDESIL